MNDFEENLLYAASQTIYLIVGELFAGLLVLTTPTFNPVTMTRIILWGLMLSTLIPHALQGQEQRWLLPPALTDRIAGTESRPVSLAAGWRLASLPALPPAQDAARSQRLRALGAEPDQLWEAAALPNDPFLPQQWAFASQAPLPGQRIFAPEAWDAQSSAPGIIVAVIDAGVDWQHEDLADNIWNNLAEDADGDGRTLEFINGEWQLDPGDLDGIDNDNNGYVDDLIGWDFVNNDNNPYDDHFAGHGTHVAGIIGARGNNGKGIAGVAWEVQLMPLKFLDESGKGYTSGAIAALQYAADMGAQLSNNSWGGPLVSQALSDAIALTAQNNHLVVAAAGNNYGNDNDLNAFFPASYPFGHLVSVGSSDPEGKPSVFSNKGTLSVDLSAPGTGIFSTLPNNGYGHFSGTSMAAPMVSGALALLLASRPDLSPEAAIARLLRSAEPLPVFAGQTLSGGILHLGRLLEQPGRFRLDLAGQGAPRLATSSFAHLLLHNENGISRLSQLGQGGQVNWTRSFPANTTMQAIGEAPDGWVVAGKQGTQTIMAHWLYNGEPAWIRTGVGPANATVSQVVVANDQWALAGSTANSLWITAMDSAGSFLWGKEFPVSANSPFLLGWEGKWLLIADGWGGNPQQVGGWVLSDQGNILDAWTWTYPSAVSIQNIALMDPDDDPEPLIALNSPTSDGNTLGFLTLDDEEPSGNISQGITLADAGAAWAWASAGGGKWWLAAADTLQNNLILAKIQADFVVEWANAIPAGSTGQEVVDLLGRPDGGGLMLPNASLAGNSELSLLGFDLRGQLPCTSTTASPFSVSFPWPVRSPGSAMATTLAFTSASATMLTGSQLIAPQLPCGVDTCQVEAFFLLPEGPFCEEDSLIIPSRSLGASQWNWFVDDELASNQPVLRIEIPDDDDPETLLITLEVSNGACSDQMSLLLEVEPDYLLLPIETSRCAGSILLRGPEWASSYQWLDAQDQEIGTAISQRFTQTGVYRLLATDRCGSEVEQFISVTLTGDCVWPGDVNADGAVDQLDFLLLGLASGETGPARPNASSSYTQQQAPDWPDSFATALPWAPGINLKHADCNGDGVVSVDADGAVILQNRTGAFIPPAELQPSGLSLTLTLPQASVVLGDTIPLTISVEDSSGQSPPLLGLSLGIRYNLPLNNGVSFSVPPSWLGIPGQDMEPMISGKAGPNASEVTLVRTDRGNRLGQGKMIGGGVVIQIDDIGNNGVLGQQTYFTMDLTHAFAINAQGQRVPIHNLRVQGNQTVRILADTSGTNSVDNQLENTWHEGWSIFPNPTEDKVSVSLPLPPLPGTYLELMNLQGQILLQQVLQDQHTSVDLSSLPSGMYLIRIHPAGGRVVSKKLIRR